MSDLIILAALVGTMWLVCVMASVVMAIAVSVLVFPESPFRCLAEEI